MESSIETEAKRLKNIGESAFFLAQYARALTPKSDYDFDGRRFVLRPDNFVTFSVHSSRANNLTVSLRGNTTEFEKLPELLIKPDQNGYSLFNSSASINFSLQHITFGGRMSCSSGNASEYIRRLVLLRYD